MNTRMALQSSALPDILTEFRSLSLPELESRARLMDRMDHKFVVDSSVLMQALGELQSDFSVLDINGQRNFHYDNCYFDDAALSCYWHHQQDRRLRFKARTRYYADADLCYVEIKLKGPRGKTIKRRLPCQSSQSDMLDTTAQNFIKTTYEEFYSRPLESELRASLKVTFQRITLAAQSGNERITIDRHLQFSSGGSVYLLNPDIAIIETKSTGTQGQADRILRTLHQHPARACSKYCIGLALLGKVDRYNRFLRSMRLLSAMPLKTGIAAANADTLDQDGNTYEVLHVANQN